MHVRAEEETQGTISSLSPRERQLLQLSAHGLTDQGIAHRLGISLATVGTYWGRVRVKLGSFNRTELVAHYLREQAGRTIGVLTDENRKLVQELHQLSDTADVLKSNLDLFRSLVETALDAILLVNADGKIELANHEAERMFGYARDEMLGMAIEALVPERYRGDHTGMRAEYTLNPVKRKMAEHMSTHAVRKDGSEFHMAAWLSPNPSARGIFVTCVIRDLSALFEEESRNLNGKLAARTRA